MYQKISLDYIIFWSSILTVVVFSHEANGILTESNDLQCTHIQCPTKCPEDSYLKASLDEEEEDFEDYEEELFDHDSHMEEIGHFEKLPPEVELHDNHSPQHALKERQKREVFFQEDIERCCDDQKCVCKKCEDVPKCLEGHVAVEIHEGQGVPGNCCSTFECVKKEVCQLSVKQSWWTSKCTKCSCFGESELCLQICPEEEILQNCYSEYWQKPMMNGAYWKEGRCTSCSCEHGDRRCLTPVCPKLDCKETIILEDECCPKCVNEEMDVRPDIGHNIEQDIEDTAEQHSTEATPMGNEEDTSSNSENYSNVPVVDENLISKTQSTPHPIETIGSSTASVISQSFEEISFTFRPESVEIFKENISSPEFSTSTSLLHTTLSPLLATSSAIETSAEDSKSVTQLASDSSATTTEEPKSTIEYKHDNSPEYASTEEPKSVVALEQDVSSTVSVMEVVQTSSAPTTETPQELVAESTTNSDSKLTNTAPETSTLSAATFIEESTSSEAETTSTIATSILTTAVTDAPTEIFNIFTTNTTQTSSFSFSIATAAESTASTESAITKAVSSPTKTMTTNENDSTTGTSTSTHHTSSTSTLIQYSSTSSLTSTTSSPYSSIADTTTTSRLEESTSKSSTTAPEPLKPLFQSYGDFNTDERVSGTQHQMRIMFDEIDYVVMIVLFMGSLLCISLGLIIRHTKNRKKMYSSIPNSETSLSQTSTNTVLTV